jgi:hypothetical protein
MPDMITRLEATAVPAARGTEPSEGPVTSLAVPNGDADMSALADMWADRPVTDPMPSFWIRNRTVVRLRPKRRAVPCANEQLTVLEARSYAATRRT